MLNGKPYTSEHSRAQYSRYNCFECSLIQHFPFSGIKRQFEGSPFEVELYERFNW